MKPKPSKKHESNEDNFGSSCQKYFVSASDLCTVVDRGAEHESHVASAISEEVYAQKLKLLKQCISSPPKHQIK